MDDDDIEETERMTGEELRQLRKSMNLRQAALAQALGLTPQFIGQMERGTSPIEPRTAMAVRYLTEHPEIRPDIHIDDVKVYGMGDMFRLAMESGPYHGKEWGLWRLDRETLTLDFQSREVVVDRDADGQDIVERRESYYITLYEIRDAKDALDWIGQIAGKGWGPVSLGHLAEALDEIFDLQDRFVHGPRFASSDEVKDFLRQRIRAEPVASDA